MIINNTPNFMKIDCNYKSPIRAVHIYRDYIRICYRYNKYLFNRVFGFTRLFDKTFNKNKCKFDFNQIHIAFLFKGLHTLVAHEKCFFHANFWRKVQNFLINYYIILKKNTSWRTFSNFLLKNITMFRGKWPPMK